MFQFMNPHGPDAPGLVSFSEVLLAIKDGNSAKRAGWDRQFLHVMMTWDNGDQAMPTPHLYLVAKGGSGGKWAPSDEDIFAEDWSIFRVPIISHPSLD